MFLCEGHFHICLSPSFVDQGWIDVGRIVKVPGVTSNNQCIHYGPFNWRQIWLNPKPKPEPRHAYFGNTLLQGITQHKAWAQEKINSMIPSPTKLIVIYHQPPFLAGILKKAKCLPRWAFCFSKQHTLCRGEIHLDKVPSAYTKNVLLMF